MSLKKFLPHDIFELYTKLTVTEVQNRITDIIEPGCNDWYYEKDKKDKPYEGKITDNYFKINRIINYRNPFLPVIEGYISIHRGRTKVAVIMKPFAFALNFTLIWLAFVGLGCIAATVAMVFKIDETPQEEFPGKSLSFLCLPSAMVL